MHVFNSDDRLKSAGPHVCVGPCMMWIFGRALQEQHRQIAGFTSERHLLALRSNKADVYSPVIRDMTLTVQPELLWASQMSGFDALLCHIWNQLTFILSVEQNKIFERMCILFLLTKAAKQFIKKTFTLSHFLSNTLLVISSKSVANEFPVRPGPKNLLLIWTWHFERLVLPAEVISWSNSCSLICELLIG